MTIQSITYTIFEDNCADEEFAEAFAEWVEAELERRYPDADITVNLVANTTGVSPRPYVQSSDDDFRVEEGVQDECDRLWEDWERAGFPGISND